jgi:hypothetical protein
LFKRISNRATLDSIKNDLDVITLGRKQDIPTSKADKARMAATVLEKDFTKCAEGAITRRYGIGCMMLPNCRSRWANNFNDKTPVIGCGGEKPCRVHGAKRPALHPVRIVGVVLRGEKTFAERMTGMVFS